MRRVSRNGGNRMLVNVNQAAPRMRRVSRNFLQAEEEHQGLAAPRMRRVSRNSICVPTHRIARRRASHEARE